MKRLADMENRYMFLLTLEKKGYDTETIRHLYDYMAKAEDKENCCRMLVKWMGECRSDGELLLRLKKGS